MEKHETVASYLPYEGTYVLVHWDSGEWMLWLERDASGCYTLNDINSSVAVSPDDDADAMVADWLATY